MESRKEPDSTSFSTADKHLNPEKMHHNDDNIHYVELEQEFPSGPAIGLDLRS
jgi:hypothetical protein